MLGTALGSMMSFYAYLNVPDSGHKPSVFPTLPVSSSKIITPGHLGSTIGIVGVDLEMVLSAPASEITEKKKLDALEVILQDASNGQYDFLPYSLTAEKVSAMSAPVYKIKNKYTIETTEYTYDKEGKSSTKQATATHTHVGCGVVIQKAESEPHMLVLTARHVTLPTIPPEKKDEQGRIVSSSKVITHSISLVFAETDFFNMELFLPLSVLARSSEADVAILEATLNHAEELSSFAVAPIFGDSDELSAGQLVHLVSFPLGLVKTYTQGIVTTTGDPFRAWDDTSFYLNAASSPGSSGGAAYALRDGRPELVGILSWKIAMGEAISGAVRVNHAKKLLQEMNLPAYYHTINH